MNERLTFVLAGLLNELDALNLFMTRTDYPRSILSRNKYIIALTRFIKRTYRENNVTLTYSRLADLVSKKYRITRKVVENHPKFERFNKIVLEARELYEKAKDDDFLNKWKAELQWLVNEYVREQRLKHSRLEYMMLKTTCFTEACPDKDCEMYRYCHEANKQQMNTLEFVQNWGEEVDQKLRCLIKERRRISEHHYDNNVDGRIERYEEKFKYRVENPDGTLGVPFSLPTLNAWTDGLCKGRAYCIAGRTGQGKSALALQEAGYVWANSDMHVLFINLEMPVTELEERLDSAATGYSFNKVLKGDWDSVEEFEGFKNALREYRFTKKNEFVILDTPVLTISSMVYTLRNYYNRWGDNFYVVLDNLNRMTYPAGSKKHDGANSIVVEFHSCIKEFNIPGMLLCQLNRDAENESRIQPKHFRDADQIPDHLDAVFAILPYGSAKKKLVTVKGRTFNGNYIILENQLERMRLIEHARDVDKVDSFDEEEDAFL